MLKKMMSQKEYAMVLDVYDDVEISPEDIAILQLNEEEDSDIIPDMI